MRGAGGNRVGWEESGEGFNVLFDFLTPDGRLGELRIGRGRYKEMDVHCPSL